MAFGQEAKHARVSAGLSVDVHQGPFVAGLKETFFMDLFHQGRVLLLWKPSDTFYPSLCWAVHCEQSMWQEQVCFP